MPVQILIGPKALMLITVFKLWIIIIKYFSLEYLYEAYIIIKLWCDLESKKYAKNFIYALEQLACYIMGCIHLGIGCVCVFPLQW